MKASSLSFKWHAHAGGTGSPDRYGYTATTGFGEYHIDPKSSRYGVPVGYTVYFVNTKGKLSGGLWQQIGDYIKSPNAAKGLAKRHFAKYFRRRS